jgi:hypothetical protein
MTPSRESIAELHRLRADAERYRFWRRIFLRRPDREARSGAPIYSSVLKTPADIDSAEFDRILDAARGQDDGSKVEFATGHIAPAQAKHAGVPAPRAAAAPPVVCRCGTVRPPTRGRRPAEWECGSCRA